MKRYQALREGNAKGETGHTRKEAAGGERRSQGAVALNTEERLLTVNVTLPQGLCDGGTIWQK